MTTGVRAPLLSLTGRAAVSTCLSREAVESAAKPDSRSPAPLDLRPCEWGSRCGKVFVKDARVSCDLRRSPARQWLNTFQRRPSELQLASKPGTSLAGHTRPKSRVSVFLLAPENCFADKVDISLCHRSRTTDYSRGFVTP